MFICLQPHCKQRPVSEHLFILVQRGCSQVYNSENTIRFICVSAVEDLGFFFQIPICCTIKKGRKPVIINSFL